MTSVPPSQKLSPDRVTEPLPAPCYIFKFPNELIAETISWLPHPVDILWLSFTCKRFHNLLIDPAASYIWKHARDRFVMIHSCAVIKKASKPSRSELTEIIEIPGQDDVLYSEFTATPIPPPFEGQGEYAFVRMLFGWKRCQRCEKGYIGKPFDILMRFALCPECAKKHGSDFVRPRIIARDEAHTYWHKLVLGDLGGISETFERIWDAALKELLSHSPFDRRIGGFGALRSDWESLIAEFLSIAETKQSSKVQHFFEVTLKAHKERAILRRNHADMIMGWYDAYHSHLNIISGGIVKISKIFATSHGLAIEDLQKSPAYRHAVAVAGRHQTMDILPFLIPETEELISQTMKIQANRIRDFTTLAHKTRRKEIEAFYKMYKFPDNIKPTLDTFRSIPILQALQRGISTSGVKPEDAPSVYYHTRSVISDRPSIQADLKDSTTRNLIDVTVLQWREGATLGARKLLGFEGYKRKGKKRANKRKNKAKRGEATMEVDEAESANEGNGVAHTHAEVDADKPMDVDGTGEDDDGESPAKWHSVPGKLDPEMRVASWFVCTSCINMDPSYKRMRVLDFRGVCAHECWQKDWNKAQRKAWNIGRFALAPRAMETAKKMLEILGLDAEDPKTTTRSLKGWWSCNNCPPWMHGMVWEDLLRHCQRHETQEIAQLSNEDAEKRKDDLGYEEKRLTFADLLSGKHETEARTKQLACVHCRPSQGAGGNGGGSVAFNAASSKAEKVMDIHGIRQHMKSKHHVSDCRNEDYYYVADGRVIPPTVSGEVAPANEEERKKQRTKTTSRQATKKLKGMEIIDIRFF